VQCEWHILFYRKYLQLDFGHKAYDALLHVFPLVDAIKEKINVNYRNQNKTIRIKKKHKNIATIKYI
jgi:hypothetical protein